MHKVKVGAVYKLSCREMCRQVVSLSFQNIFAAYKVSPQTVYLLINNALSMYYKLDLFYEQFYCSHCIWNAVR